MCRAVYLVTICFFSHFLALGERGRGARVLETSSLAPLPLPPRPYFPSPLFSICLSTTRIRFPSSPPPRTLPCAECYASNNLTAALAHGINANCVSTCAGNASEICGGGWVNSVYSFITPPSPLPTLWGFPPTTSGLVGLYSAEDWDGKRWVDASGR